jgi:23S rRNA pseudouridine1911/1915/1917 synthase
MAQPVTFRLTVEAELHGVRIDSFLVRHFRNYTPWRMQRLAAAGHVWINEAPASPTQRVFVGEEVRVELIEPPDKLLPPQPVAFRLIYEDPWIVVVDKPAGVISHPTGELQSGTLANGLQAYLDTRTPLRGLLRPGLVHRLDGQTSGLMVVALHHRAHAGLSTAFETRRVSKTYLAIVHGRVRQESGSIDLPIGRTRQGRGVLMSARGDAIDPRPSKTQFCVEERFAAHSLLRATPLTGRNHQIRVHLAEIGHPIVGDVFYAQPAGQGNGRQDDRARRRPADGDRSGERAQRAPPLAANRHALHATSLSFAHPISGVWLKFESPLPADLRRLAGWLRHGGPPGVSDAPVSGGVVSGEWYA